MVQSKGSQRLVESQNAAISPRRINHRFFRAGVNRAAGAEAGGDNARPRIARADGAHHVVAPAGADKHAAWEAQFAGCGFLQLAGRLVAAGISGGRRPRQIPASIALQNGWRPLPSS